jgi:hypothetical protein
MTGSLTVLFRSGCWFAAKCRGIAANGGDGRLEAARLEQRRQLFAAAAAEL